MQCASYTYNGLAQMDYLGKMAIYDERESEREFESLRRGDSIESRECGALGV